MGPRLRWHHEDRGHNIDIAKQSMKQVLVFMSHWIAEESEQQRLSKQWVKDRLREPEEPRKRKRQRGNEHQKTASNTYGKVHMFMKSVMYAK